MREFNLFDVLIGAVGISFVFNGIDQLAWVGAAVLLAFCLILITIELWMCYHVCGDPEDFDWRQEILNRSFAIALVPVSMIADVSVYYLVRLLPANFAVLDQGYLFFTMTTLVWTNMAFTIRILNYVRKHSGADVVPPPVTILARHIRAILHAAKVIDEQRYKESNKLGKMNERWPDHLSEEQLTKIAIIVNELPPQAVPSDPTVLLEKNGDNQVQG